MGPPVVPSTASLARVFRAASVARVQPKKKPRSAWRRLVYPAPNACWQLDATEHVLTRGRRCVIFQLIDDHSRYAVASRVARGETVKDAIAVFDTAVVAHGVPQRLLSDNGLALNRPGAGLRPAPSMSATDVPPRGPSEDPATVSELLTHQPSPMS
ncbi:DDE-type integrase/transposase/recombinase [Demetria terragena]|uniref:DDE-type integrase/transposase/recombinase n=1 Tax=Demetria terragena TaxID=63959 RepID=UPI001B7FDF53